ncbi:MAG: tetratricopeptide repeat protein [Candidatus Didemnitutus sp.]|nr:tetratricopeptide repeat protein [Candidatus Didemnitutus sp.]
MPAILSRLIDRPWLAGTLLVLLAATAYLNSFRGQFLFDDHASLVDNPALQHFSTALLPPADGGLTLSGRPLLALSFALNRALGGIEPWSYHLLNLAIHLANGLLFAAIVRRTLRQPALAPRWAGDASLVAFVAAALWLLHPLQTESVTYIVQRAESLVALCYLATWYFLIRAHEQPARRHWPVAAFIACLAGMAAKEVMATAPLVLALYDRLFLAGSWRAVWIQRGRLHVALAGTWLLLGAFVLSTAGRGGTAGFGTAVSVRDYALTQFPAIAHYLRLFVWPRPLVLDYGTPLVTDGVRVLPAAALVLGMLAASAWAVRRGQAWGFAVVFFFVVLAPSSSVVPIATQTMAEHRTYLPLAGLCVLVAAIGVAGLRTRVWFVFAPLALVLGGTTWLRNALYASRTAMYEQIVAHCPANARAMALLGDYYLREDNVDAAQRWLERSVALEPVPEALNNLGNVRQARGDFAAAQALFARALAARPRDATTLSNLGNALLAQGHADEAIARFEAALQARPDFAGALYNLANTLAQTGRLTEAVAHYERLLALTPADAEARANFSAVLAALDRPDAALAQIREAVRLRPDHAGLRNACGVTLVRTGRVTEALAEFEAAVRLAPENADYARNVALARDQLRSR